MYWFEQTQADVPATDDWFGPMETVRLSSLRFPKRRADWRLGRWTAKLAVAAHLQLPTNPESLAEIEIIAAPSGAPEVFLHGAPAPINMSISHREDLSICVLAPAPTVVGCDLEFVEPRSDAFIADYFTAEEQKLIAECGDSQRAQLIALLWSAKESVLKVLKEGLRFDTRSVEVSPSLSASSHGDWNPFEARSGGELFRGCWRSVDSTIRTCVAHPASDRLIDLAFPNRLRDSSQSRSRTQLR